MNATKSYTWDETAKAHVRRQTAPTLGCHADDLIGADLLETLTAVEECGGVVYWGVFCDTVEDLAGMTL